MWAAYRVRSARSKLASARSHSPVTVGNPTTSRNSPSPTAAAAAPPQALGNRRGRRVPLLRVLLQALQADGVQVAGQGGDDPAGRDRVLVPHLDEHVGRTGPGERR